jgi:hypothetical protein
VQRLAEPLPFRQRLRPVEVDRESRRQRHLADRGHARSLRRVTHSVLLAEVVICPTRIRVGPRDGNRRCRTGRDGAPVTPSPWTSVTAIRRLMVSPLAGDRGGVSGEPGKCPVALPTRRIRWISPVVTLPAAGPDAACVQPEERTGE